MMKIMKTQQSKQCKTLRGPFGSYRVPLGSWMWVPWALQGFSLAPVCRRGPLGDELMMSCWVGPLEGLWWDKRINKIEEVGEIQMNQVSSFRGQRWCDWMNFCLLFLKSNKRWRRETISKLHRCLKQSVLISSSVSLHFIAIAFVKTATNWKSHWSSNDFNVKNHWSRQNLSLSIVSNCNGYYLILFNHPSPKIVTTLHVIAIFHLDSLVANVTSSKSWRMCYFDKCWLSTDFYWFLQAF